MGITGMAEMVLWTRDKDAAVGFYRDLLGFEIISPPVLPNVFLKVAEGRAGIPQMVVLVPLPEAQRDELRQGQLHHLAFEVDEKAFDALAQRLETAGFQPRGGKHPVLASRTLYIDDPDGNEIEFICRAEA